MLGGLLGAGAFAQWQAPVAGQAPDPLAPSADVARPPSDVQVFMDWVRASRDAGGRPFFVLDKLAAEVFAFDSGGTLVSKTPALIGSAKGDESAPGIGDRELRNIAPADRTTPAGRFIAKFGWAAGNQKVLWVDWSTAVSMHPVPTSVKRERRLQRLASATPEDNRITYGCINVSAQFYREVVVPLVADSEAIVYILPEQRSPHEVFPTAPAGLRFGAAE